MQLPVLWPVSVSIRTLTSQGIGFLETWKNPANSFKNNLNNTRNNMKSQIKKKNSGIVELLIPTLIKIVRNQELCSSVSIVNFEQVNASWNISEFIKHHPGKTFFFLTHYFWDTHRLMYKKLDSFVYRFVVNYELF